MIWVSVLFALIEPISAFMLASLVVHTHPHHPVPLLARAILAALAVGLIVHAAGSVELVFDHRPPRTWAWLGVMVPVNAMIWFGWFWARAHHREKVRTRRQTFERRTII